MYQAVMSEPGKINFQEIPEPEPGSGEVKLKLKAIGVCGSDIHVWHGKHPYTSYPVVQGHEVSAEVVSRGEAVKGFSVGDRVTVQPQVVCGRCYSCTHGMYHVCSELKVMGFQTTGLAAEYFVVAAEKLVKLPSDMSWEHGAMIEPLAVAVHALRRFGAVKEKSVLVLGGGPIGNLVAQTAKAQGARGVLLSEISTKRLEIAKQCGITVVNPQKEGLQEAVASALGSDGADVIFECVGAAAPMDQAITVARKGSDIVVVGVFGEKGLVDMGLVQDHELRLIGTAMYREEDYFDAVALAAQKMIELDGLVTHRVKFRDYTTAYEIIEQQKDSAVKVMVLFD